MKDIKKYQGVIPAFYACYDAEGNISIEVPPASASTSTWMSARPFWKP